MVHVVRQDSRARTGRGLDGNQGFTLLELLVVILVLTILAAVGIPLVLSATRALAMNGAAREIQAALLQARTLAITTRQNVCLKPVSGGFAYLTVSCTGAPWTGANTDSSGTFHLSENVTTSGGAAIFTPFGSASQTTTITVSLTGGGTTTVTVKPSGRVTIP
jgi:prepilin-type N-terminal cleavage/methylation domain-containing protein